ncbi:hypothetical protein L7F22_007517 [Adiantum nelumboides]|nr:hypothetical protein [Adiantum nelumboides]
MAAGYVFHGDETDMLCVFDGDGPCRQRPRCLACTERPVRREMGQAATAAVMAAGYLESFLEFLLLYMKEARVAALLAIPGVVRAEEARVEAGVSTYVVQLFEVTCEECNGVLKFVIKLDECELVKETKVEQVTITLMNRALDESISANDPRNFSVQSENNIFLLATFKERLLELKKLQKHVSLAIPKLPFQRLVRDICEQNNLQFRWSRSGLGCLHEATEDFLIEFFQDSYVMTAHAHRSTLMPRDFNSLRLLRFRYDKTLVPVGISDRKMDNILNIPPLGKVKVTDLSRTAHQYGTRLNVELESLRENEELDF